MSDHHVCTVDRGNYVIMKPIMRGYMSGPGLQAYDVWTSQNQKRLEELVPKIDEKVAKEINEWKLKTVSVPGSERFKLPEIRAEFDEKRLKEIRDQKPPQVVFKISGVIYYLDVYLEAIPTDKVIREFNRRLKAFLDENLE